VNDRDQLHLTNLGLLSPKLHPGHQVIGAECLALPS